MICYDANTFHASAPPGMKCADCTMGPMPCPLCYKAWWSKANPHTTQYPEDTGTRCKANRTADPPQDCDAPFCGCNPAWTQCMEWLEEMGWNDGKELGRAKVLLHEAESLAALGDIDENTEAYGWGEWMRNVRQLLGIVSDTPLRKLPDKVLEVGLTPDGRNVVLNHPTMLADPHGIGGHIIFSPDQAYELALIIVNKAQECK